MNTYCEKCDLSLSSCIHNPGRIVREQERLAAVSAAAVAHRAGRVAGLAEGLHLGDFPKLRANDPWLQEECDELNERVGLPGSLGLTARLTEFAYLSERGQFSATNKFAELHPGHYSPPSSYKR
jgi:hypothetical protein